MNHKLRDCGRDTNGQEHLAFYCPGCEHLHAYQWPRWSWNGSLDAPTFTPSLLNSKSDPERICHLFVTDGRIQYCGDCHHALAGKTVDMVDEEKWFADEPNSTQHEGEEEKAT